MVERRRSMSVPVRTSAWLQHGPRWPAVARPRTQAAAATAAPVAVSHRGEAGETIRWGGTARTEEGVGGVG